jgi:two-component system, NtrC family, sensor kinase
MSRSDKPAGKPTKTQSRKTLNPGVAAKLTRPRKASTTVANQRIALLEHRLNEALEQQEATSEVLKVISSSPGDMKPVFETILSNALRICEAKFGHLLLYDGERFSATHLHDVPPSYREYWEQHAPILPSSNTGLGRLARTKQVAHIPDLKADSAYAERESLRVVTVEQAGARSFLAVPMLKENILVGAIVIYRREVRPFTDRQIELVKNFAAQAVIAIENARLLNELRQRTGDLTESLQQQTATADVLSVISRSPSDVAPVFDVIGERAEKLCSAEISVVSVLDGDRIRVASIRGISRDNVELLRAHFPMPLDRNTVTARTIKSGAVVHIGDVLADTTYDNKVLAEQTGYRSCLGVPMHHEGQIVGAIFVARTEPGLFSDNQIRLLEIFADQAVIAIQNVRMFEEVQARTRDLSEALTYQTASSNILGVIASSPTDIGPALQAIVESACKLCGSYDATVVLKLGSELHFKAHHGPIPTGQRPRPISREWVTGRAVVDREPVQMPDFHSPEAAEFPDGQLQSREQGHRCTLAVPLLREGEAIGALALRRLEPVAFNERQISVLQSFADQAVIAIENVRLFDEVQAKTDDLSEALRYQTGSARILNVIASSPTDVQPVLKAIVESACELCDAYDAVVILKDGEELQLRAHHGPIPMNRQRWANDRTSVSGRAIADRWPVHIHDVLAHEGVEFEVARGMSLVDGCRTLLSAPLLREGDPIGALVLRRSEVHPFSEEQIRLLQTFADQAVIAIGNVRLFEQVQQRTRELSKSLEDLRAAQERLVQTEKLASLGHLTAGIAHEIKNPLNFVNNFSALSAELIDEMKGVLSKISLGNDKREELDEITRMLKSNLEKVVQHGKRADSIVKNMLQHSREGSGENRSADINAIVDESLNLAYHGARAEKAGFSIVLRRELDPSVGEADIYPQEITRVLLNLISNGFYAATKRKEEAGDGFEPTLSAMTKNLGERVEIRIRDNGTGIPEQVRAKIFNPFFTTKPSGEGTGLGLSISHDIIVKQHGGTIDVESAPGKFTEFRIVIPRTRQK